MTAFVLKLIALATMIIDHIDKILPITAYKSDSVIWQIYDVIILTGRMAFPIYAFLIAEGCKKTRSMPKYIFRLFMFMLISEVFYIMAFYGSGNHGMALVKYAANHVAALKFRNIFATLMFGAVAVYACQLVSKLKLNIAVKIPIILSAVLFIMLIAEYFNSSYGFLAIGLIFLLYLSDDKIFQAIIIIVWCAVFYLLRTSFNGSRFMFLENFIYWKWFAFACLAVVPVILYNGERGKSIKWAFYIIYPLHLMLFTAVRELVYLL